MTAVPDAPLVDSPTRCAGALRAAGTSTAVSTTHLSPWASPTSPWIAPSCRQGGLRSRGLHATLRRAALCSAFGLFMPWCLASIPGCKCELQACAHALQASTPLNSSGACGPSPTAAPLRSGHRRLRTCCCPLPAERRVLRPAGPPARVCGRAPPRPLGAGGGGWALGTLSAGRRSCHLRVQLLRFCKCPSQMDRARLGGGSMAALWSWLSQTACHPGRSARQSCSQPPKATPSGCTCQERTRTQPPDPLPAPPPAVHRVRQVADRGLSLGAGGGGGQRVDVQHAQASAVRCCPAPTGPLTGAAAPLGPAALTIGVQDGAGSGLPFGVCVQFLTGWLCSQLPHL